MARSGAEVQHMAHEQRPGSIYNPVGVDFNIGASGLEPMETSEPAMPPLNVEPTGSRIRSTSVASTGFYKFDIGSYTFYKFL